MQLGATATRSRSGSSPFVSPGTGVGRLFGRIGDTNDAVTGRAVTTVVLVLVVVGGSDVTVDEAVGCVGAGRAFRSGRSGAHAPTRATITVARATARTPRARTRRRSIDPSMPDDRGITVPTWPTSRHPATSASIVD